MSGSSSEQSSRCFLLELPAELRIKIYQYGCQLSDASYTKLLLDHRTGLLRAYQYLDGGEHLAWGLTRGNRQIRGEVISILYQGMVLTIHDLHEPKAPGFGPSWLEIADAGILAAIRRIDLMISSGCWCRIEIVLHDLDRPVSVFKCDRLCCYGNPTKKYRHFASEAEPEIMSKLEIAGGKRRVMTREAMKGLLRLFQKKIFQD